MASLAIFQQWAASLQQADGAAAVSAAEVPAPPAHPAWNQEVYRLLNVCPAPSYHMAAGGAADVVMSPHDRLAILAAVRTFAQAPSARTYTADIVAGWLQQLPYSVSAADTSGFAYAFVAEVVQCAAMPAPVADALATSFERLCLDDTVMLALRALAQPSAPMGRGALLQGSLGTLCGWLSAMSDNDAAITQHVPLSTRARTGAAILRLLTEHPQLPASRGANGQHVRALLLLALRACAADAGSGDSSVEGVEDDDDVASLLRRAAVFAEADLDSDTPLLRAACAETLVTCAAMQPRGRARVENALLASLQRWCRTLLERRVMDAALREDGGDGEEEDGAAAARNEQLVAFDTLLVACVTLVCDAADPPAALEGAAGVDASATALHGHSRSGGDAAASGGSFLARVADVLTKALVLGDDRKGSHRQVTRFRSMQEHIASMGKRFRPLFGATAAPERRTAAAVSQQLVPSFDADTESMRSRALAALCALLAHEVKPLRGAATPSVASPEPAGFEASATRALIYAISRRLQLTRECLHEHASTGPPVASGPTRTSALEAALAPSCDSFTFLVSMLSTVAQACASDVVTRMVVEALVDTFTQERDWFMSHVAPYVRISQPTAPASRASGMSALRSTWTGAAPTAAARVVAPGSVARASKDAMDETSAGVMQRQYVLLLASLLDAVAIVGAAVVDDDSILLSAVDSIIASFDVTLQATHALVDVRTHAVSHALLLVARVQAERVSTAASRSRANETAARIMALMTTISSDAGSPKLARSQAVALTLQTLVDSLALALQASRTRGGQSRVDIDEPASAANIRAYRALWSRLVTWGFTHHAPPAVRTIASLSPVLSVGADAASDAPYPTADSDVSEGRAFLLTVLPDQRDAIIALPPQHVTSMRGIAALEMCRCAAGDARTLLVYVARSADRDMMLTAVLDAAFRVFIHAALRAPSGAAMDANLRDHCAYLLVHCVHRYARVRTAAHRFLVELLDRFPQLLWDVVCVEAAVRLVQRVADVCLSPPSADRTVSSTPVHRVTLPASTAETADILSDLIWLVSHWLFRASIVAPFASHALLADLIARAASSVRDILTHHGPASGAGITTALQASCNAHGDEPLLRTHGMFTRVRGAATAVLGRAALTTHFGAQLASLSQANVHVRWTGVGAGAAAPATTYAAADSAAVASLGGFWLTPWARTLQSDMDAPAAGVLRDARHGGVGGIPELDDESASLVRGSDAASVTTSRSRRSAGAPLHSARDVSVVTAAIVGAAAHSSTGLLTLAAQYVRAPGIHVSLPAIDPLVTLTNTLQPTLATIQDRRAFYMGMIMGMAHERQRSGSASGAGRGDSVITFMRELCKDLASLAHIAIRASQDAWRRATLEYVSASTSAGGAGGHAFRAQIVKDAIDDVIGLIPLDAVPSLAHELSADAAVHGLRIQRSGSGGATDVVFGLESEDSEVDEVENNIAAAAAAATLATHNAPPPPPRHPSKAATWLRSLTRRRAPPSTPAASAASASAALRSPATLRSPAAAARRPKRQHAVSSTPAEPPGADADDLIALVYAASAACVWLHTHAAAPGMAGGAALQDELMFAAVWLPMRTFNPALLRAAIQCWAWMMGAHSALRAVVCATVRDAWVWTVQQRLGLFSGGAHELLPAAPRAHISPRDMPRTPGVAPLTCVTQPAPVDLFNLMPEPTGSLMTTPSVVTSNAGSGRLPTVLLPERLCSCDCHAILLEFLQERFWVARAASPLELSLLTCMISAATADASLLSTHAASLGPRMRLVHLGLCILHAAQPDALRRSIARTAPSISSHGDGSPVPRADTVRDLTADAPPHVLMLGLTGATVGALPGADDSITACPPVMRTGELGTSTAWTTSSSVAVRGTSDRASAAMVSSDLWATSALGSAALFRSRVLQCALSWFELPLSYYEAATSPFVFKHDFPVFLAVCDLLTHEMHASDGNSVVPMVPSAPGADTATSGLSPSASTGMTPTTSRRTLHTVSRKSGAADPELRRLVFGRLGHPAAQTTTRSASNGTAAAGTIHGHSSLRSAVDTYADTLAAGRRSSFARLFAAVDAHALPRGRTNLQRDVSGDTLAGSAMFMRAYSGDTESGSPASEPAPIAVSLQRLRTRAVWIGALGSMRRDCELFLLLMGHEIDRMVAWHNPNDVDERRLPRERAYSFDAFLVRRTDSAAATASTLGQAEWTRIVCAAWEASPTLAYRLLRRFHRLPEVLNPLRALAANDALALRHIGDAAELLVHPAALARDDEALRSLLLWAPATFPVVLSLLSRCSHEDAAAHAQAVPAVTHPFVAAFVTRSLRRFSPDLIVFLLPQLVQGLRHDSSGQVADYLFATSQTSMLVAHQLVWTLVSESKSAEDDRSRHMHSSSGAAGDEDDRIVSNLNLDAVAASGGASVATERSLAVSDESMQGYHGFQRQLKGLDSLPSKAAGLMQRIVSTFPPTARSLFELQYSFWDAVANVSGRLKLEVVDASQRRAKIREFLRDIKVAAERDAATAASQAYRRLRAELSALEQAAKQAPASPSPLSAAATTPAPRSAPLAGALAVLGGRPPRDMVPTSAGDAVAGATAGALAPAGSPLADSVSIAVQEAIPTPTSAAAGIDVAPLPAAASLAGAPTSDAAMFIPNLVDVVYMPTAPHLRVVAVDMDSGRAMQSAAKCPYRLTFDVVPYNGPDATLRKQERQEERLRRQQARLESHARTAALSDVLKLRKRESTISRATLATKHLTSQLRKQMQRQRVQMGLNLERTRRSVATELQTRRKKLAKGMERMVEGVREVGKAMFQIPSRSTEPTPAAVAPGGASTPDHDGAHPGSGISANDAAAGVGLDDVRLYDEAEHARGAGSSDDHASSVGDGAGDAEDDDEVHVEQPKRVQAMSPVRTLLSGGIASSAATAAPAPASPIGSVVGDQVLEADTVKPKRSTRSTLRRLLGRSRRSGTSGTMQSPVGSSGVPRTPAANGTPAAATQKASCIFKVFDDCRQDSLVMQVVQLFQATFARARTSLRLYPYRVLPTRTGSKKIPGGILEVVPDVMSRDEIGKTGYSTLFDYFVATYGRPESAEFESARMAFIESLAAYSVVCYIMRIKDRHNGNLLVSASGAIIHIDFGFVLGISPGGNLGFETAAFKLTQEMVNIMGGSVDSEDFLYFSELVVRGFMLARDNIEAVHSLVACMADSGLPCYLFPDTLQKLWERFVPVDGDVRAARFMRNECLQAANRMTTILYDGIQKLQQNIHSEAWQ